MKLPRLSLYELEHKLREAGCFYVRQTGSHRIWNTPMKRVISFCPGRQGDGKSLSTGGITQVEKALRLEGLSLMSYEEIVGDEPVAIPKLEKWSCVRCYNEFEDVKEEIPKTKFCDRCWNEQQAEWAKPMEITVESDTTKIEEAPVEPAVVATEEKKSSYRLRDPWICPTCDFIADWIPSVGRHKKAGKSACALYQKNAPKAPKPATAPTPVYRRCSTSTEKIQVLLKAHVRSAEEWEEVGHLADIYYAVERVSPFVPDNNRQSFLQGVIHGRRKHHGSPFARNVYLRFRDALDQGKSKRRDAAKTPTEPEISKESPVAETVKEKPVVKAPEKPVSEAAPSTLVWDAATMAILAKKYPNGIPTTKDELEKAFSLVAEFQAFQKKHGL